MCRFVRTRRYEKFSFKCQTLPVHCRASSSHRPTVRRCYTILTVVTHSQETCTSRLVQETWPSDMVSCTRFFVYKFLAPMAAQLYSIEETCMHVTRMVSSDWSAAYRCHVFILLCWCCLLYKVNIVCLLIYFLNLFKLFKQKLCVPMEWSTESVEKVICFVQERPFLFDASSAELDARNLCKFLAQVSWLCVTTIIIIARRSFKELSPEHKTRASQHYFSSHDFTSTSKLLCLVNLQKGVFGA